MQINKRGNIGILIPVLGILLFAGLYIGATILYPGGSQKDKNAAGFSWANNYWCNLLNDNAINGQKNKAKPVAITGMVILCVSLLIFWLIFPKHVAFFAAGKRIIQISGTMAMFVVVLLLTNFNHDDITNLASMFGLIATLTTITALYKNKWFVLFGWGLLNILLVLLNNILYYSNDLIHYLPIVQKISFACFLIWICCITFNMYLRSKFGNLP